MQVPLAPLEIGYHHLKETSRGPYAVVAKMCGTADRASSNRGSERGCVTISHWREGGKTSSASDSCDHHVAQLADKIIHFRIAVSLGPLPPSVSPTSLQRLQFQYLSWLLGHAVAQCLRHYVTSPKAAGSTPAYLILRAALRLGVYSAANRNEYQKQWSSVSGE
jgi:hypothetical protein